MLLIVIGFCGGAVYYVGSRSQSQPIKVMGNVYLNQPIKSYFSDYWFITSVLC